MASISVLIEDLFGKLPKTWRGLFVILVAFFVATCSPVDNDGKPGFSFVNDTSSGGDQVETPEVGDSLALGFENARPGERIEIFLNDDVGNEWSYARVFADTAGSVDPMVFWYHSGVIGVTSLDVDFVPDPAFKTFEEAELYFAEHSLILTAFGAEGKSLATEEFFLRPRQSAMIYPSNSDGVLMNAMNAFSENVFVSGRNFPAGATVFVGLVPNQYDWHQGDMVRDITGEAGAPNFKRVQLASGETSFTIPVWDRDHSRTGAFDIIARIDEDFRDPVLRPDDLISYNGDTGIILYAIINGNVVIEVAGRMKGAPAKFEFNDSFEKGQTVAGAVDPTDVPPGHTGGNYAAYVIIEDQPPEFYDGFVPPMIADVSGGAEIHRVKYWCINGTRTNIWIGATQAEPIKGYDVIVDFGAVPAMNAADFVFDNTYNKGLDFVDGYDTVGFYVFEDPSSTGTFLVGEVEVDEPNGISGMPYDPPDPAIPSDTGNVTGPTYLVDLAWGYIMYPATVAGIRQPVDGTLPNYPVALFMHGRHSNCDSNGNAEFGSSSYAPPGGCDDDKRIPSHRGYDYIMRQLATQGIIAVSIDTFEIQADQSGPWNYEMRARLVLKWLDKLRDWNDNGTDPFGGIFQGKIDMNRIAISGHSRGGEGVVGAQQINKTWPVPHNILAVNAIAPTDQNQRFLDGFTFYFVTESSYYLILGARDGDLWNMQGTRPYDRAYPEGMPDRKDKMMTNVYGANHNYFNTVWTPTAALGKINPWAGALDDGPAAPFKMDAAGQRQISLTTIAAFFRWKLQGLDAYKEIFTGRLEPSAMDNANVYWAYQDKERVAVDNFEQLPLDPLENTLIGTITNSGFSTFAEQVFNYNNSNYSPALPKDNRFFHDTLGMRLGWATPQTYVTELPGGFDASPYTHLTFRVAKRVANTLSPVAGPDINLFVQIEDSLGATAMWPLRTDQFDPIPHPFQRNSGDNRMILTGVRIPLRNFTQNASGVNVRDIVKITIVTEGSDEIGIDDIEFAK